MFEQQYATFFYSMMQVLMGKAIVCKLALELWLTAENFVSVNKIDVRTKQVSLRFFIDNLRPFLPMRVVFVCCTRTVLIQPLSFTLLDSIPIFGVYRKISISTEPLRTN